MNSETIKAIGVTKAGGAEILEVLDIPRPKLEPHDILVQVKAISVNPIDYKARSTSTEASQEKPRILGYDASGVVVELGSQVKDFKIGEEVFYAGSLIRNGTNASLHAVDSRIVGHKPKSLSHSEAAGVPLVFITAWEAFFDKLGLTTDKSKNEGKTLLIIAGAGGVGSVATQIAKKVLGLTVIATASRSETIDYVKKLGADHVINHRNPLSQELEKIGFKHVDYAFHCYELTKEYVKILAEVVRPFGAVAAITYKEDIDPRPFFYKSITLAYELMFTRSMFGYELERQGEILNNAAKLLDEKVLVHTVNEIKQFNLENLKNAHIKVEKGEAIGKIVLDKVDEFN